MRKQISWKGVVSCDLGKNSETEIHEYEYPQAGYSKLRVTKLLLIIVREI